MALGHDGPLFVLAADLRAGHPETRGIGDLAARRRATTVVRDAFAQVAADAPVPASQLGLLVATELTDELTVPAGTHLVVPVGAAGEDPFALAHGDDFGAHLEATGASIAEARVQWGPDDATEVKKIRSRRLDRLGAWLHETGRSLLLDLDLAASPDTVPSGDARTEAVLRAVDQVRALGLEPDLWGLPDLGDAGQRVAEAVHDAGRDGVAVLVREPAPHPTVLPALTRGDGTPAGQGFVLGPALWAGPLATDQDPADVVAAVAAAYRRAIDLDRAARSA